VTIVAGIDEAGRGSVLGPLFVGGVSIEEHDAEKLSKMGVKDSKLLAPAKRRKLYKEIRNVAVQIAWERIEPKRIDEVVFRGTRLLRLNYLEALYMAKVLSKLERFDHAYVDCCDTVEKRFGDLVADLLFENRKRIENSEIGLGEENPYRNKIMSEHHADSNHVVVAAASIVAKVRRDSQIARLQKEHGPFGSGYPSDPDTKEYIRGYVERSETLPSITRLSWATVKNLYLTYDKKNEKAEQPLNTF
jgi:ribonuclease HII